MPIAGLLLAAGSATRMGRNKLLEELGGEPMLRRAARAALDAGLDPLLVVVGHEAERAAAALAGLPCRTVANPRHAAGMNTSLTAGVEALPADASAAVVLLADMPFVTAAMIRALVERHRAGGAALCTCRYGGTPAPPTLYARTLFAELAGGEGEGRGRELVRRHGDAVGFVDWPASALADVDAAGDLEAARQRLSKVRRDGMSDDAAVLDQAAAWSDAGLGVALATVTSTWGSALRPTGSQLAVNERGAFQGSVSGGCVEAAVVQEALEAIRDGKPRRLRYGVSDEQAWEVGMACGGAIEIYVERLS